MKTVEVKTEQRDYSVHIADDLLSRLPSVLPKVLRGRKIAVIADRNIVDDHAHRLMAALSEADIEHVEVIFEASEALKTIETYGSLFAPLIENHFERGDAVLAIGGGVTGDLVGFVAASYLRGVPFIQIPTTLLAMVDASVGGKVACNHSLGKNLIGAFHQPHLVLADTSTLGTLPREELISGLAECIKHGAILDADLFDWTISRMPEILAGDSASLVELVERNVRCKAEIVAADEREAGRRALLNFGHTFGHAIEAVSGYGTFRHGEAVALGMIAATQLSVRLGFAEQLTLERLIRAVELAGLPTAAELPATELLIEAMKSDKKVASGKLKVILLREIGEAFIQEQVEESDLSFAFECIRRS